jgi:hypothetical protein
VQEFIDRYLAVWHEPDTKNRRAAVEELWTPDAVHALQPTRVAQAEAERVGATAVFEARGHDALEARVAQAYAEFVEPGEYVFRARDRAARVRDVVRFTWDMVPVGGGDPVGGGTDFFVLDGDGRIHRHYQFVDG